LYKLKIPKSRDVLMRTAFLLTLLALVMSASTLVLSQSKSIEIKLTSKSFDDNGIIPSQHTCEGKNQSPQLSWSNLPKGTKTVAIICDDPDAPRKEPWVHWVIYNISIEDNELPENLGPFPAFPNGAYQGLNDYDKLGWGGPCPPKGTHRYFFRIYALDCVLEVETGLKKAQLLKAMEGHILGKGQLIGKYTRKK
jgi:Raf kinase inhibitor-like YbhB/YbcL family protein